MAASVLGLYFISKLDFGTGIVLIAKAASKKILASIRSIRFYKKTFVNQ